MDSIKQIVVIVDNNVPLWVFPIILLLTTLFSYRNTTYLLDFNEYSKSDYDTIKYLNYLLLGVAVIEMTLFIYYFYNNPVYEIRVYQSRIITFLNTARAMIMSVTLYLASSRNTST